MSAFSLNPEPFVRSPRNPVGDPKPGDPNAYPLEGETDPVPIQAHLTRRPVWTHIALATQFIFTVLALALAIPLASIQLTKTPYDRTVFAIFATVFSQLTWLYIFLLSVGLIERDSDRRIS